MDVILGSNSFSDVALSSCENDARLVKCFCEHCFLGRGEYIDIVKKISLLEQRKTKPFVSAHTCYYCLFSLRPAW